jgi:hypothetical protein
MLSCRPRHSCRELFFKLEILPLPSQYILSLLMFRMRNKKQFLKISEIYHINTRQQANLHLPLVNVTKYQKGVYTKALRHLMHFPLT